MYIIMFDSHLPVLKTLHLWLRMWSLILCKIDCHLLKWLGLDWETRDFIYCKIKNHRAWYMYYTLLVTVHNTFTPEPLINQYLWENLLWTIENSLTSFMTMSHSSFAGIITWRYIDGIPFEHGVFSGVCSYLKSILLVPCCLLDPGR